MSPEHLERRFQFNRLLAYTARIAAEPDKVELIADTAEIIMSMEL